MNLGSLLDDWSAHEPSELARAVEERRARGGDIIDLITANPHEHGLVFPHERLTALILKALAGVRTYRPDPLGRAEAREAIGRWYARRGVTIPSTQMVLTPGTSAAYFYAFRLLCGEAAEVLVPKPSYPLFDDLARVAGASTRACHLRLERDRWHLDPEEVRFQITSRTRAIVLVSPHNPTGHVASSEEIEGLASVCREADLPLIVDEVFSEWLHGGGALPRPAESRFDFPLVITLNGFSKMFSLPGHKVAWMAVSGDAARVARMVSALAYLNDTFLPMSEVSQAMAAPVLDECGDVSDALAIEVRRRHAMLRNTIKGENIEMPQVEGGPYLPILLPEGTDAETFACHAARGCGVLVHPGGLYGVDVPAIITTCIAREGDLLRGIERLFEPLTNTDEH